MQVATSDDVNPRSREKVTHLMLKQVDNQREYMNRVDGHIIRETTNGNRKPDETRRSRFACDGARCFGTGRALKKNAHATWDWRLERGITGGNQQRNQIFKGYNDWKRSREGRGIQKRGKETNETNEWKGGDGFAGVSVRRH